MPNARLGGFVGGWGDASSDKSEAAIECLVHPQMGVHPASSVGATVRQDQLGWRGAREAVAKSRPPPDLRWVQHKKG